jgi:hypothetical protein
MSSLNISQSFDRKHPATVADIKKFLDQVTTQGVSEDTPVKAQVNFRAGIIQLRVGK